MSARKTAYEDGLHRMDDAADWHEEERQAIERSDAVITVSDAIFNLVRQQGYQLPELTHIYANYIPERLIPRTLPQAEHKIGNRPIRIVYEGFLSNSGSHYDLRAIFRSLAAEGIELHIYPSRDNSDYQTLADTVANIVYHPSLAPEKLFEEITPWTLEHEKYEVMRILGEASVPCSAVLDTRDLYRDPHLVERGFVKSVEHPELGQAPLLGFPTRMSDSSVEITRAPYIGEHSEEVLRQDLDIGDPELAALRDSGILG